jgi:dihydroorotase
MSDVGMPLLVHGEVTDQTIDIFDREKEFINTILRPLIQKFSNLKVVMEHITTEDAVNFVAVENKDNSKIVATITAHHLLYNRNHIFVGGICPHMYCLPILKRECHRIALLNAATSGSVKFFIGTDSAPHTVESKQSACGCAGIFTGHAPIELYAEAFESINKLDKLEGFLSIHGQKFYNIKQNIKKIKLIKQKWLVPDTYKFGDSVVRPLRAGEYIQWTILE